VAQTIKQLQDAGVEPDVWKIEGLDRRADCEEIVSAAQDKGRDKSAASFFAVAKTTKRCTSG